MNKYYLLISIVCFLFSILEAQVLIDDFQVNNSAFNLQGLGRPAIAADADGNFAVAWQDYNENDAWVLEIPRIALQRYSPQAVAIGPLNLFRGEDRYKIYWNNNYLEPNPDLTLHPNGTALVAVENQGWFWTVVSENFSAEVGYGAVSTAGEMLDASGSGVEGNVSWLYSYYTTMEENPRISVAPDGNFFIAAQGISYDSEKAAIIIQQYNSDGSESGELFTPHTADPNPNFSHTMPDVATNGSQLLVVWQDHRQDENGDISAQYYNSSGAVGSNFKINQGDAGGILNIWPSVHMNSAGRCVVVWADTRSNLNGEIFGQIYDAQSQAVGENFQISSGHGQIIDRPEVALTEEGNFMVVWTDSIVSVNGPEAYRARGRKFNASGEPAGDVFIIPNHDIASGLPNIATAGTNYYLTWLDNRKGETHSNLFSKKISSRPTSINSPKALISSQMELYEAYPNPFNAATSIRYHIPITSNVQLQLFDIRGRHLKTLYKGVQTSGEHTHIFRADGFSSGLYLIRISAGSRFSAAKKLILIK